MTEDQRILNEPARQRQREAAEGRARLSLPLKSISEPRHYRHAQQYQHPAETYMNEGMNMCRFF